MRTWPGFLKADKGFLQLRAGLLGLKAQAIRLAMIAALRRRGLQSGFLTP